MTPGLPMAEANEVLAWLLVLWAAGWLCRPLARLAMPGQGDDGVLTGLALGWTLGGFAPWCAAALGLIDFTRHGPAAAAAALGAAFLLARPRAPAPALPLRRRLGLEGLALGLFGLGLVQRLAVPDLVGLEKFTDLAFLTAAMQATAMPFPDPWFAGEAVNYYHLGHATAALWGNLAGLPAHHAYQLAVATLFALTGALVWHLLHELLRARGAAVAAVAALAGTALVLLGGNGHSFLYQALRPWMPTPKPEFFYPDSTRFIGFEPPTDDKAFTEFPAYGFLVGDLHAHLLATPLAFLVLALLLALLRRGWEADRRPPLLPAGLLGWLLGVSYLTNAWDLAVSGLGAALAWALLLARQGGPWRGRLDAMAAALLVAAAAAAATAAPFLATFRPFAAGLRLVEHRTPPWQLLVIYGFWMPGVLALGWIGLRAGRRMGPELAMALLVAGAALLLVALPEAVFVKDIYGADHARANTMFKLTFRAQPMLALAALAAAGWLARERGRGAAPAAGAVLALACLPLAYAGWTLRGWPAGQSLDGLRFLGEERALAEGLAELPLAPGESLVEAASDAFTQGARMATVTGRPSVLGWMGHEWLWRDDLDAALARQAALDRFYREDDPEARCRLIARHRVRYVVLGAAERERTPGLDEASVLALGREALRTPAGAVVEVDPRRCPP